MEISFHVKKTMNADNGEKNQCCVSLKRKKNRFGLYIIQTVAQQYKKNIKL